jgi:membrane protein YqaA with SNARE-associated domain
MELAASTVSGEALPDVHGIRSLARSRFRVRLRWIAWGTVALLGVAVAAMSWDLRFAAYAFYALYSLPSNSVVPLLNEPGLLLFAPMTTPVLLALAGVPGTALGASLDYTLLSRAFASSRLDDVRAHRWTRYLLRMFAVAPSLTVFLFALLPLPFWAVRVLAPASGLPMGRYVAAVVPGRFLRYYVVAWLGVALGIGTDEALILLGAALLYLVLVGLRSLDRYRRPRPLA